MSIIHRTEEYREHESAKCSLHRSHTPQSKSQTGAFNYKFPEPCTLISPRRPPLLLMDQTQVQQAGLTRVGTDD